MDLTPHRFALLPFLLLAGPALGQVPLQGMSSGFASGLLEVSGDGAGNETILLKTPNNRTTPPYAVPGPGAGSGAAAQRDYRWSQMSPNYDDLVDVNAHSTGNDVIPVPDGNGTPILGPMRRWLVVNASVRNGNMPTGPLAGLRNQAGQANRQHGADIISFYMPSSQGIDPALLGQALVEQRREQMGFGAALTEIDGLDFALGVQFFGQRTGAVIFSNPGDYYFSLTPEAATAINLRQANTSLPTFLSNGGPVDSGSIYVIPWINGGWGSIDTYRTMAALDLSPGDDLDALAVDPIRGTTVFSTAGQPAPGNSQIMLHEHNPGNPTSPLFLGPLASGPNTRVTDELGIDDEADDVDALCLEDPEGNNFGDLVGTPTLQWGAGGDSSVVYPQMGISTSFLPASDDGVEKHLIQVTGFGGPPASGLLVLVFDSPLPVAIPQPAGLTAMNYVYFARSPSDYFVEFTIPRGQVSVSTPVEYAALFMDPEANYIATTWRSTIRWM